MNMLKFKWETEFKETEIGEIPGDWEIISISEGSFAIIMGQSPPSKYYNKEGRGMPFIQGRKDFGDLYITPTTYTEKCGKIAPPNSVLLTVRAPVGDVNITKDEVCIGRGLAAIYNVNGNPTLNRFIYYVLVGLKDYIAPLGERGTTYEEIIKEDLENILIPYPPPPEQSRIATVLSWFDNLIENKKRQNEILEKVAMAIFKSWFVDFEPFKDEEFVYNEELGKEIPKGWEVKKLGEFVSTQYGFTASGEETGKIKLLRIKDINKAFVIDWDSVPFCNITNDIFPKYRLKNMDIVISRIGDIGKVAIVENPPLSVFASYLIRLKIKNHKLTPYYLYYWLKAPDYQEYIQGAAEGSTRPNTNAEVIKAGPILIPPSSLIEKFEEVVFPIRSKIILNQKQIMVLRKIRDALLPKLVFGKLRVEEV